MSTDDIEHLVVHAFQKSEFPNHPIRFTVSLDPAGFRRPSDANLEIVVAVGK
jgi:hypothetical protein